MIKAENIVKSFDGRTVLKNISVQFEAGQTNLIIGRSGSGKTVLLKCLVGLHEVDEGAIYYDDVCFSTLDFRRRKAIRRDVGMIFLDYRFTIPNYPSRLLSYMQAKLPVLCATDPNTDIGMIAEENGFGLCCMSNDSDSFIRTATMLVSKCDLPTMGQKSYDYMMCEYTVEQAYRTIMK